MAKRKAGQARLLDVAARQVSDEEAFELIAMAGGFDGRLSVRNFCLALIRIGVIREGHQEYTPKELVSHLEVAIMKYRSPQQLAPEYFFPSSFGIASWVKTFLDEYIYQIRRSNSNILDLTLVCPQTFVERELEGHDSVAKFLGTHRKLSPGQMSFLEVNYEFM